jgi:heme O synthase-like polyprenyltransferase
MTIELARTTLGHYWLTKDRGAPVSSGLNQTKRKILLYTIAVVLIILWLLGLVTGYTIGSFIHVLLVIAIVMVLVNFISRRRQA